MENAFLILSFIFIFYITALDNNLGKMKEIVR